MIGTPGAGTVLSFFCPGQGNTGVGVLEVVLGQCCSLAEVSLGLARLRALIL